MFRLCGIVEMLGTFRSCVMSDDKGKQPARPRRELPKKLSHLRAHPVLPACATALHASAGIRGAEERLAKVGLVVLDEVCPCCAILNHCYRAPRALHGTLHGRFAKYQKVLCRTLQCYKYCQI